MIRFLAAGLIFGGLMDAADAADLFDIPLKKINGTASSLDDYRGKVLVIVNTASKCGYTPQYEGLQKLYENYKDRNVVVLGFPSNDFGRQEPGSNEEIQNFCKVNYGVTFPLFEKSVVTGDKKNPLFKALLANSKDKSEIKWNFEKFVVDGEGRLVGRFRSSVKPDSPEIVGVIEHTLTPK